MTSSHPTSEELHFIEDVALSFENGGLPRMSGRILGWLLICDPAEQTADQIRVVLQASKGSISATTRSLVTANLIERIAKPGDRRTYFRINYQGWEAAVMRGLSAVTSFRTVLEQGIELVGAEKHRRARLESLNELYTWIDEEIPPLFARYQEWRAKRRGEGASHDQRRNPN